MQITGPIGGQWWGEVVSTGDWINLRQKALHFLRLFGNLKISFGA